MNHRNAKSAKALLRPHVLASAAVCLGLAACSGMPKTKAPAENLAYPPFGAPAQIGDKPVMDQQTAAKTQTDLENLARNRASQVQQQIDQGGDLNTGQ